MKNKESEGRVEAVLIMLPGEGAATEELAEVAVEWDGFLGDKHFGATKPAGSSQKTYPKGTEVRNTRQVSIVSSEELNQMADALGVPEIKPDWVGANMLISGIPKFSKLQPGTRLHFPDGVGLVIEGENMPCTTAGSTVQEHYPDIENLVSAFPKKALGKRGVVAWVERPGLIRKGDSVVAKQVERSIRSS
jgi:hypothetical protein